MTEQDGNDKEEAVQPTAVAQQPQQPQQPQQQQQPQLPTEVRINLDDRRRDELGFLTQPRTYGEFGRFIFTKHKTSAQNAHWRLGHNRDALIPMGLAYQRTDGKYELTDKGRLALAEDFFMADMAALNGKIPTNKKPASNNNNNAQQQIKKQPTPQKAMPTQQAQVAPAQPTQKLEWLPVHSNNGVEVPKIHLPDYLWSKQPTEYIETSDELTTIDAHMTSGIPLLLSGPKGVGKTKSVIYYAWKNQIPIVIVDCNQGVDESILKGQFVIKGNESPFILGTFPVGISIANAVGKCIVLMEEINALTPNTQKVTNATLDERRNCTVPELAKTFQTEEEVKMLVVGNMNYGYGGTYDLNEDFESRFVKKKIDYPDKKNEARIIQSQVPEIDEGLIEPLINLAVETRSAVESSTIDYALSPRDLVLFGKTLTIYLDKFKNPQKAMVNALNNGILNKYYDTKEREFIAERIQSYIPGGVKLKA